jgi:hypothetical protein
MAQSRNDEVITKTQEFLERNGAEDIPKTSFILLMRWAQRKRGVVNGADFMRACGAFLEENGEKFYRCPESVVASMMIDLFEAHNAREAESVLASAQSNKK